MRSLLIFHFLLLVIFPASAEPVLDYRLSPVQVAKDTYVFIGKKEDFSFENGGNIVNTGFIVTTEGVVVIDTGPSYQYGLQMRQAINKVTNQPIIKVLLTHHHPDHILGNQAFSDVPIYALPGTINLIKRDASAFLDNVFRMVGDWMRGTELFDEIIPLLDERELIGGHDLTYISMEGHTGGDLIILDETTAVLFAGDLVFHNRALTTPHAEPDKWKASLRRLNEMEYKIIVPGHGEIAEDKLPIMQTLEYLIWLEDKISESVEMGLDMNEVLESQIPERFQSLSILQHEFARSVIHRYPVYEEKLFNKQ